MFNDELNEEEGGKEGGGVGDDGGELSNMQEGNESDPYAEDKFPENMEYYEALFAKEESDEESLFHLWKQLYRIREGKILEAISTSDDSGNEERHATVSHQNETLEQKQPWTALA
ncbi:hypothetical protein Moror_4301 [Moniliophthora roreri MCA 2997]|uniref:Uncharacterized protein n=1 Tax=Moniliophthora roreri (strain MCA 2997) TaxID=1381753 RepID=V2XDF2_MONRO|nr:hypothetical protein Moror_4301 [Moniliophthora roreri MCA 2997]